MAEEEQKQNSNYSYQVLGSEQFQPAEPLMYYSIGGRPAFSWGDVHIKPNQKILVDGTAMLWMDGSLEINTECYGGTQAACMRSCAGESCCMNQYSGVGKVSVGFEMPGDMLAFGVTTSHSWLITRAAFVAGTENLRVSSRFSGCLACCCADEGPFLTTVEIDKESGTEQGVFLAGSYGMLQRHDIPEGKKMFVARGCFFATHASRSLDVTCVGGLTNYCCGAGPKTFVMRFEGPCTVYTQSRNPEDLRRMQTAAMQEQQKEQNQDGGDAGGDAGD